MPRDVRKETNNLRDILKPFVKEHSLIDEGDSLLFAPTSEFIVVNERKFYLVHKTSTEIKNLKCPTCKAQSTGFGVSLKSHTDFPDKWLAAIQCDSCKNIMIIDIPAQVIK